MSSTCCFTGSLHAGTPQGREIELHGLPCYISIFPRSSSSSTSTEPLESPIQPRNPNATIVILPDGGGWAGRNLRLLADVYARRSGATILIPEFMGGYAVPESMRDSFEILSKPSPSWWAVIAQKIPALTSAIITIVPFLYGTRHGVVTPRILKWFDSLRREKGTTHRIGAAGFCWGGRYAAMLCREDLSAGPAHPVTPPTPSPGKSYIDCAFAAHPSDLIAAGDLARVRRPFSLIVGDVDIIFQREKVEKAEGILVGEREGEGGGERNEVVVLKDAMHGFALRGRPDDKKETEQAQVAEDQAMRWFARWLGTEEEEEEEVVVE